MRMTVSVIRRIREWFGGDTSNANIVDRTMRTRATAVTEAWTHSANIRARYAKWRTRRQRYPAWQTCDVQFVCINALRHTNIYFRKSTTYREIETNNLKWFKFTLLGVHSIRRLNGFHNRKRKSTWIGLVISKLNKIEMANCILFR